MTYRYQKVITPGASVLSPKPKAILVTATGNITIENPDGVSTGAVSWPAGLYPGVSPHKITAAVPTVIALY